MRQRALATLQPAHIPSRDVQTKILPRIYNFAPWVAEAVADMMDARHACCRQILGTEDRGQGLIGMKLFLSGLINHPRGGKNCPT
jgi:hypothetical protein